MTVFERQVLDALAIAICTVDLDGRISMVNRAWSRSAHGNGPPPPGDETGLRGQPVWEAIPDIAPREQVEQALALLRTGRAQQVSWERRGGSPPEERILLVQVTPLLDDRSIAGCVLSAVDITPSHRSRETLLDIGVALSRPIALDRVYQEAAQQLRGAGAGEAIAIALIDGDHAGHDDVGALRLAYQVGCGDDAAATERRFRESWREALRLGRPALRRGPEGLDLTAPMVSPEGVLGAISIVVESEPPRRIDEAELVLATVAAQTAAAIERAWLVRRAERQCRLEAIGEVAAGVAHELRNPLSGISSAAQLLRFRAKDDPVIEKNVGRILREVERLGRMSTALLEYGRPRPTRLTPGDPDDVWDGVLEGERGRLESSALALRRSRAKHSARCAVDAEHLAQVLVNVLANAIDAAPVASDLTLTTSVLPNGGWRCRLHNDGPPIPPDALPRVFELFFTTKPGGTGIGLALCQRIVEEHGGSIAIESAPGAGTTVTIQLPPAG